MPQSSGCTRTAVDDGARRTDAWSDGWSRLARTLSQGGVDGDRLFEAICRDVVDGFGFARSILATVDQRHRRLVARAGYDPNLRTQAYLALLRLFQIPLSPRPDGRLLIAAWCAEHAEQVHVPDASLDAFKPDRVTHRPFVIKALGTSEYALTPVVYRGRSVAVLGVDKKGLGQPISTGELTLLRDLAGLLALRLGPLLTAEQGRRSEAQASVAGVPGAVHSLLDLFEEALIVVGADERVRFANAAVSSLLGMATDELTGRQVGDVLRFTHEAQFDELLRTARSGSGSVKKRERLRTSSGSEIDVQLRIVALDRAGGAQAILLLPGGERSESRRFQDEVVQSLLHDLLAPVQSMVGFAELLQLGRVGSLTTEQGEFVARIVGAGEELIAFIERVLTVNALESREAQPMAEPVEAAPLVDEILRRMAGKALRARVHLRHNVNGQIPCLCGEPARFSAVFQNLIDNAIDATMPGGTVRVTACLHDDARFARFSVSQTGGSDGMGSEAPAFDEDWTQRGAGRRRRSHGLGLSIVKRVVEHYGGELWAAGDAEGEFSITFTLPVVAAGERVTTGGAPPP
jgi:PAS domain S-box-containing protein